MRIDDSELERRVAKALEMMSHEKLLRLVSTRQLAWVNENFRKGGAENKWEPLAPRTVYVRRKGSSKPLQDTGRLKQSFVQNVRRTVAVVGTTNQVAGFHHAGTNPYFISPQSRKFLTIPDRGGPATFEGTKNERLDGKKGYFSKGVRHPGLPARPLLPSKALGERMAQKTIVTYLRKTFAR